MTLVVSMSCPPMLSLRTEWSVEDFELHQQLYNGEISMVGGARFCAVVCRALLG